MTAMIYIHGKDNNANPLGISFPEDQRELIHTEARAHLSEHVVSYSYLNGQSYSMLRFPFNAGKRGWKASGAV